MQLLQSYDSTDIIALVLLILTELLTIYGVIHAIMYKKDPRAAVSWTGLIILVPVIGVILYWLLGVNRVRRRAKKFSLKREKEPLSSQENDQGESKKSDSYVIESIKKVCSHANPRRLHENNSISLLVNGEAAYPEMLEAINHAKYSVGLCSYIFDNDTIGQTFAQALKKALDRGVDVKILVDDIGLRHSFPSIVRTLKRYNIPYQRFHRTFWPWSFQYAQLRNHRKLLLVDANLAFLGGMNIRDNHLVESSPEKDKTQDIHFKVTGPIIQDLLEVFKSDWQTKSKVSLSSKAWKYSPPTNETISDDALLRVASNGPDEHYDQLRWTLLGTISCAQHSIFIQSPYFLPDQSIISALGSAALKGVQVVILIPEENNHKLVHWAFMGGVWQLLDKGCQVYLGTKPFDHSKLFIIDSEWSFIGSSNWDARSLRLNFELNLECYDKELTKKLDTTFKKKLKDSNPLDLKQVNSLPFILRLRNSCARLLTPYL